MRVARLLAFLLSSAVLGCIAGVALPAQDSAVAAEVVTVPLVVTDGEKFAEGFPAEYLEVREDGKARRVVSLEHDPTEPLYVAVLMEYSRHLPLSPYWHGYYFPEQEALYQEAMTTFSVLDRLGEDDRMALVLYGTYRHLEVDFTGDKQAIVDVLEHTLNNPTGPAENEVTLYTAVIETLEKLKGKTEHRKVVLLVVGTGQDTFGGTTLDEAMQAARTSGVQVVFVQIGWDLIQRVEAEDARVYSQTGHHADPLAFSGPESEYDVLYYTTRGIAESSGGFAVRQYAIGQAQEIAETVIVWTRSTHRLTYEAPPVPPDGKVHKLKISFVREMTTPDGEKYKPKAYSIDGRRTPKPKKEKKGGRK